MRGCLVSFSRIVRVRSLRFAHSILQISSRRRGSASAKSMIFSIGMYVVGWFSVRRNSSISATSSACDRRRLRLRELATWPVRRSIWIASTTHSLVTSRFSIALAEPRTERNVARLCSTVAGPASLRRSRAKLTNVSAVRSTIRLRLTGCAMSCPSSCARLRRKGFTSSRATQYFSISSPKVMPLRAWTPFILTVASTLSAQVLASFSVLNVLLSWWMMTPCFLIRTIACHLSPRLRTVAMV